MQMTVQQPLGYYKLNGDVKDPVVATSGSACFDVHAYLPDDKTSIKCYSSLNNILDTYSQGGRLAIHPGARYLVPTGLIFDIPQQCSVRLHARSGLALKQGLVLANAEGVIDEDYVDPVYVMLTNISDTQVDINNGDRICQAELVYQPNFAIMPLQNSPAQKTDRDGGFGSTGV
jgi:dUTP pyrophosphatase